MSSTFQHKIRVRYAECDQMGFVHHSIYALYLEEARTEILRKFGLVYSEIEKDGIIMPVRNMNFTFYKAARYDDLLTIEVSLAEKPVLRYKFNYKIYNQHNEELCEAYTELFFVRKEDFKPIKLPEKYQPLLDQLYK